MASESVQSRRGGARRAWLAGLALVAAALLAHLPSLQAGWLWDDDALVLNACVTSPDGLADIWAGRSPQEYLPLTTSLYWLEYRLWGASAAGFHAVALLLHAAAVLACWRLLVAWSRLCAARLCAARVSAARRASQPGGEAVTAAPTALEAGAPFAAPWWGALFFAVHPVAVASVAWAAETKNMLAVLLAALAAQAWVAWLAHGSRRALGLGLCAFTLALLAKSALVMLPAVLLVLAWWHVRSDASPWSLRRRDLLASAPFFVVSLVLGLVTVHVQHTQTMGAGMAGSESLWLRLAVAGRSVWWYVGKALLPQDLTVVYARWTPDPSTAGAWWPLVALLAVLVVLLRARLTVLRAAGAGLAAFALLLLPALGLIELSFMAIARVSDHFAYPALLVPCALVAFGGERLAERWRRRGAAGAMATAGKPGAAGAVRLLWLAGALVAVVLGTASFERCRLYASQVTLFGDNVARVPEAWLAQNNLGGALLAAGDAEAAEAHLRRAIESHPAYGEPRDNLAKLLLDAGRLDEARVQIQQGLVVAPELPGLHADLGRLELAEGHVDAAIAALERALQLDAEQAATHNVLGVALASRGAAPDIEAAERSFRRALELRPDFPEALNNLGRLLLNRATAAGAVPATGASGAAGATDAAGAAGATGTRAARTALLAEAERCLRRALELSPEYAAARENLEAVLSARR